MEIGRGSHDKKTFCAIVLLYCVCARFPLQMLNHFRAFLGSREPGKTAVQSPKLYLLRIIIIIYIVVIVVVRGKQNSALCY